MRKKSTGTTKHVKRVRRPNRLRSIKKVFKCNKRESLDYCCSDIHFINYIAHWLSINLVVDSSNRDRRYIITSGMLCRKSANRFFLF
ncbi:hypothetical protein Hdeb2414_s0017g00509441 [Helianthus debilis subsp. tardiflorus]